MTGHPLSYWILLFSGQTFSCVNTPTVLSSSHTSYHLPMKMEQIECSETSAYKIHTPRNYPKENTIYSEHGESLKSRIKKLVCRSNFTCTQRILHVSQKYVYRKCFRVMKCFLFTILLQWRAGKITKSIRVPNSQFISNNLWQKERLISATIPLFELISSEMSTKPLKPLLRTGENIIFTFYTRFKFQMSPLTIQ